ncbi:hypothetical protein [Streptomyces sp. ATCC 21386]|uniref:hypothetical protein n=1 Tax=Streptomyces sp. ATCC 21386 TaxID=2699428 RepID=UPI001BFF524E|nr:hypothetical protein [Streptomyces sp. ATCC 21386]
MGEEPVDRALREGAVRPSGAELLHLLVLRADVALRLGDEETATGAPARAADVELTDEERHTAHDALVRLEDLREREQT